MYGAVDLVDQWHSVVAGALDSLLPDPESVAASHSSSEPANTTHHLTVGAKPAVGSDYFAWCFPSHIPLTSDIIFVESAVNDEASSQSSHDIESLLRGLLSLEHRPAVVLVESWSLKDVRGHNMMVQGGDSHLPVAAYYDVPVISIRDALHPHLLNHPTLIDPYFSSDPRHIAAPLHRALGSLVSHFIHSTLCSYDRDTPTPATLNPSNPMWPSDDELGDIPRVPMMWGETPQPDAVEIPENPPERVEVLIPTCQEAGYNLDPISHNGWKPFQWKFEKNYWVAERVGKVIKFKVTSASGKGAGRGRVAISYLRSKLYGLGKVRCWVDEREKDAIEVEGAWEKGASIAQIAVIAEGVEGGEHTISCRTKKGVQGGTAFRIIAVMAT